MFFGEKLKSVRELNGISRKELAELINVSEQAVWQYENQHTVPAFMIINKLKKLFLVKPQFFYTKPFIKKVSDIEHIAYRSPDREARKKAKMETTYLNFVDYVISDFEQYLAPSSNAIAFMSESAYRKSIQEVAQEARKELALSNNKDLMYRLELAGIYILEKNIGPNIDAYSTWTKDDRAFIILGNIKKSAVRRNFDLAHELGHLLLHKSIEMDSLSRDEYRQIEKEANDFASYFLMPEDEFMQDFQAISKRSNPYSYLEMKTKYMVSIMALEYRAYNLGLLTFEENRYFYSYLNRHHLRAKEPLDEDISVIKPGKVRALLSFVFDNKLTTLNKVLDDYNVDVAFLENLLDIDDDFFHKFQADSAANYFQLFSNVN